jgi:diguanylate cyclase (GGDEF)-like protein
MIAAMAAFLAFAAVAVALFFAVTALVLARRAAALRADLERAVRQGNGREDRTELAASLDPYDVVVRALEASIALEGVDAALVSWDGDESGRLVKALGMSQEQADQQSFPDQPVPEGDLRSRLALPLQGAFGARGFLAVYSNSARDLEREVGAELADVARRAGPALENAFYYREARRLADLDGLTGLRNRRYFHETLRSECARAQRYGRALALLVLDVDDFKAINERVGHLAGDAVLAEAATRLRSVLRASDIACRVGGDEFAIILPEARAGEAAKLYRRVEEVVSAKPIASIERLTLSGGVAELTESDDAKTFFERADHALYLAKSAGKAQLSEAPTAE